MVPNPAAGGPSRRKIADCHENTIVLTAKTTDCHKNMIVLLRKNAECCVKAKIKVTIVLMCMPNICLEVKIFH